MTQMIYPSGRVITYTRDSVKCIQIITETDLQRNLIKDYVWSNQMMPVAQIDAVIPAQAGIQSIETITYLYTDHLMTNRLATGQSKTIIWRWEGEAFGNTPAQELSGVSINLRFPGQYYDSETNLHYNHFRYYDPSLGRYITSDPIGLDRGINTYSYVGQNPIIYFDLLGLTSNCSYYLKRCREVGGPYYCGLAPLVCETYSDTSQDWDGCVRLCLQEKDYPVDCDGTADDLCIIKIFIVH